MYPSQNLIKQLLAHQTGDSTDTIFLSAYIPLQKAPETAIDTNILAQRITSPVIQALRDHPVTSDKTNLHQQVRSALESVASSQEILDLNSTAVFIRMHQPDKIETRKSPSIKSADITATFSSLPLTLHTFVGRVYDLTQLSHLAQTEATALVVNLDQQQALIYTLAPNAFKLEATLSNDYLDKLDPGADEYLEVHRPTRTDKAVYSTGSDTVAKTIDHANQLFINNLTTILDKQLHQQPQYDFIILMHSQSFTDMIDSFMASFEQDDTPTILTDAYNHSSQDDDKLRIRARECIYLHQSQVLKQQLVELQEDIHDHAISLEEVVKAARKQQIDTLYIKNHPRYQGYLSQNQYIYLEPQDEVKKVSNLVPWLSYAVLKANGTITIINSDQSLPHDTDIAARLRYPLNREERKD